MRSDAPSVVDALLDELADRLVARLVPLLSSTATSRHADAKRNPLGSERAFLDAGRRGAFPTFKRGRNVAALWTDVERYVESRPRVTRPAVATDVDDDRALLEANGVRLQQTETR